AVRYEYLHEIEKQCDADGDTDRDTGELQDHHQPITCTPDSTRLSACTGSTSVEPAVRSGNAPAMPQLVCTGAPNSGTSGSRTAAVADTASGASEQLTSCGTPGSGLSYRKPQPAGSVPTRTSGGVATVSRTGPAPGCGPRLPTVSVSVPGAPTAT